MKTSQHVDPPIKGLLEHAIQGDQKAFGVLYTRYLDEIYRYIYFRVASRFDAEDLTETVFIKAWTALPQFNPKQNHFRAWLYRIAHNTVIDFYRTHKDDKVAFDDQNLNMHASMENQMQEQDDIKMLLHAIHALDDKLQQVIICRFINGMSHAETAEMMGIREGHVRVLQLRGLQKLRLILEQHHE